MRLRSQLKRRIGLTALAVLLIAVAGACAQARPNTELLVWTVLGGSVELNAQNAVIDAFEKENPGVTVQLVPKAGQFTGDNAALIAAVRGKQSPNVYVIDRFTTAQQASVGLLSNLQTFIDKDGENLRDQYLPFAADEASYNGDMYALPFDTDARGVLYNKAVLRDAGIDPEIMDPKNGPLTIDELMDLGEKINQKDKNGNYTRMGFIPWDGQGFHATWALINHAEWFDNQTCDTTFLSPGWKKTMEDFQSWSKELGYQQVQAFIARVRPPNQPPQQSPLYTGKIGMAIDGNWSLQSIKEYAPKLDYGITYLPVPKEGDAPISWAGGFAATMPKGAPNQELTWKFMKYFAGEQGQRIYMSNQSKIPTWKSLLEDPSVTKDQGIFPSMMADTLARPALPVGAQISDAMDAAQSGVLLGEETPAKALDIVQARVGPKMKQFCPFTLGSPE